MKGVFEMNAVIWSFLAVLGAYVIIQVIIFCIRYDDILLHRIKAKDYLKDEQGLLHLEKFSWWKKVLLAGVYLQKSIAEKEYVKDRAEDDAERSLYRNYFANSKIEKLYDTTFKKKRMEMIAYAVKRDAQIKAARVFSTNKAEQAMYQEMYLKEVSNNMSLDEIVNKRSQELYNDHKSNEPIDFKKFKEFIEAA